MFPKLQRIKELAGIPFIFSVSGTSLTKNELLFIKKSKPSGFIFFKRNIESSESLKSLIAEIKKASDYETLIYSIDEEGGRVRRLPNGDYSLPSAEEMAVWENNIFEEKVYNLAKHLSSIGINMDMAPVVDLRSGEKNSIVGDRSFGFSPEVVIQKALAFIKGLKKGKTIPVIKHFPGHGTTTVDSHKELPKITKPLVQLLKEDLLPYIKLSELVDFVMVSHILAPEVSLLPASLSKEWNNILKNECKFKGFTILDDVEMLALNQYTVDQKTALFIEADYSFMPVCSGNIDVLNEFWESMIKEIEKNTILESKFSKLKETIKTKILL